MQRSIDEQAYQQARRVLRFLLLGVDPDTNERISDESVMTQPDVKVALALGIEALQTTEWVRRWQEKKKKVPERQPQRGRASGYSFQEPTTKLVRAGQGWTVQEEMQLRQAIQSGRRLKEVCAAHGRTAEGILARMVHLGIVNSRHEARQRFRT